MIEQCLSIREVMEFVKNGWNADVIKKFEEKYKEKEDSERITYGRFMGDLSTILHELGHTGRAYFGPTNSKTDIDLIA